jgi:hypothetical protein
MGSLSAHLEDEEGRRSARVRYRHENQERHGVGEMMSLNAGGSRPPLVLLVDPVIPSRHWMWRSLSRAFGVLEAGDARGAREWMARRPDIDALVVEDDLPDERGMEFVRALASDENPIVSRSIVLARPSPDWARLAHGGATLLERGDPLAVVAKLASWFLARDAGLARALLRDAGRRRS